ncbi:MAG TPA: ABC transporter permease [Armatimonadetes bacterium]|nr:ABC transporter permease [Armatimonadota bacterium]
MNRRDDLSIGSGRRWSREALTGTVALLGQGGVALGRFLADGVLFSWQALWGVLRGRIDFRQWLLQMEAIGVQGLPLVLLTVGASGMVLAVYTAEQFRRFGAINLVGGLVTASIVREIGPVFTAIVIAARSGSAIAAEIGTMKVTEQIDALRALATNPVEYLLIPRLLAAMVALPLLTVAADIAGAVGGYLVGLSAGISSRMYINSALKMTELDFFWSGLVKAVIFAWLIVLVSARQGFRVEYGAAEVGRATTSAVVISILLVHATDYLLALIFV